MTDWMELEEGDKYNLYDQHLNHQITVEFQMGQSNQACLKWSKKVHLRTNPLPVKGVLM